jgi:hypothetical protein
MKNQVAVGAARLLEMSPAELDELFRQRPAGRVPVGRGEGTAIVLPGTPLAKPIATVARLLAWQGKVVRPDGKLLKNLVSPLGVRAIKAEIYRQASWLDGQECIVLDYSRASLVARKIRDEIREVSPGVYLGLVYWGRRLIARFALAFS